MGFEDWELEVKDIVGPPALAFLDSADTVVARAIQDALAKLNVDLRPVLLKTFDVLNAPSPLTCTDLPGWTDRSRLLRVMLRKLRREAVEKNISSINTVAIPVYYDLDIPYIFDFTTQQLYWESARETAADDDQLVVVYTGIYTEDTLPLAYEPALLHCAAWLVLLRVAATATAASTVTTAGGDFVIDAKVQGDFFAKRAQAEEQAYRSLLGQLTGAALFVEVAGERPYWFPRPVSESSL